MTVLLASLCAMFAVLSAALAYFLAKTAGKNRALRQQLRTTNARPAIIAHEIRTPLSLIQGAGELLAEQSPGTLNPIQENFVRTINENSRLVYDIAENFLTDLQLQKNDVRFELIDIRAIAADAAKQLRKISTTDIHIDAVGGLLPIHADERLIRQLMWNLINNAARHAGPNASILVTVENGEGGGVHIVVADSGRGMDENDLEQLFVPFASGSTRRPGSGIGMMVSKKIVDLHRGRIFVDSSPNIGTSIHVTLPLGDGSRAERSDQG